MGWFSKKTRKKRPSLSSDQLKTMERAFDSAKTDSMFSSWSGTPCTADEELRSQLILMRNRVRNLCQNSEYARKFLAMCKINVIGPKGIHFQAKTRREDGSLDQNDNNYLEQKFFEWGKNPNYVSLDGRQDWLGIQNQVMETLARDGECFIRMMRGASNPFGLSLWVMEGDCFPVDYNLKSDKDTFVIMGVEQNKYGKPLAYYQTMKTPDAYSYGEYLSGAESERVPADQIIHLYIQERPGQSRGVPWLNTAIRPLQMLNNFQESELLASRIGSSAMGFFTSPDGQGYSGSDEEADGNLIQEFQPGMFQQLPQGMQFESFDPKHPNTAYADFVKQILRSVSSGTLVSYNSLASDLESVNYSSIRAGAKEEQSQWQSIQEMVISRFMNPVYEEWLKMGITAGALNLPIAKMEKFKTVKWHPRGWSYVDPEKELKAKKLALEMGATSLAEITGEMGKEWTDILAQLKSEKELVESLDLGLIQPLATEKEPIPETENETEI